MLVAQQAARGDVGGAAVAVQRAVELALLDQQPAFQVVHIGVARFGGEHLPYHLLGLGQLAQGHLGAGHAEPGPGGVGRRGQRFEDLARFVGARKAQQQLAGQSPAPVGIGLPGRPALHRESKTGLLVAFIQGLQDGAEFALALARLQQPSFQRRGGARPNDEPVERRFGRFHHLVVRDRGAEHDEHRAVGQLVLAPEFVEQFLAVVGHAVEFARAQHDVEGALLQRQAGVVRALHRGDVPDTQIAQLCREGIAHRGLRLDDQCARYVDLAVHQGRLLAGATRWLKQQ